MANRNMTLGFKLLSAYHVNGISKADVASLAKSDNINWDTSEFEDKINQMAEQLYKNDTFIFWNTWNKSLLSLTSQAVAINFLVITLKDWERKGSPKNPSSSLFKSFIKNALTTFDQQIYEYITNQWKGSSDSKIKRNIAELENKDDIFTPISENKWIELIDELFEGRLNGKLYSNTETIEPKVKLLLLYYYTLAEISGPDGILKDYDFDHVLSRSAIKQSNSEYAKMHISNIFNIAPLSKRDNIKKNDRPLNLIGESWLKQQIEKYAEIKIDNFSDFCHPNSMQKLYELRIDKFRNVFTTQRKKIIES